MPEGVRLKWVIIKVRVLVIPIYCPDRGDPTSNNKQVYMKSSTDSLLYILLSFG